MSIVIGLIMEGFAGILILLLIREYQKMRWDKFDKILLRVATILAIIGAILIITGLMLIIF